MNIFFLKRLKKRNNYDDLKTLPTTWDVTWAYDNYYNNTTCSPYIGNHLTDVRYRWR